MPKRFHQSIVSRKSIPRKSRAASVLGMEETIEDLDESKIQGTDPGSLVIMKNKKVKIEFSCIWLLLSETFRSDVELSFKDFIFGDF